MTTLIKLLEEYGDWKKIPYLRFLETSEWNDKRSIIIHRDGNECTSCHNRTTEYLVGKHIWWLDYMGGIKQPNNQFWDKLGYYEKLLGDKFVGISLSEEDYEIVPEERSAAIEVNKQYYLQVHHKYYIEGKNPWDYDNEGLITLCNWCHFELHQKQVIPFYTEKESQLFERKMTICCRCHGAGFFPEYAHVQDGICFRCDGAKFDELMVQK